MSRQHALDYPMKIVADETQPATPSPGDAAGVSTDADTALARRPNVLADSAQRRTKASIHAALFGSEAGEAPKIGRYRVLTRLGEGGMGVVYSAYDEQLDRKVAVKLLRGAWDSSEGRARAIREARALARLSHPNVVQVYEVGEVEGEIYVAMEFLTGSTLYEWMAEARRPWTEVLDVFRQAAEGLAAAHRHGVIHRDFKPANAILGGDGRVHVLDFGLAHFADVGAGEVGASADPNGSLEGYAPVTQTGAVMGTPAYMAPEQFAGRRGDAQSDQFSFCTALYEALYRMRPFEGDSLPALVAAVSEGRIRPPPPASEVPAWLHRVVVRGLNPDPSARWPSMSALFGELARDRRAAVRRVIAAGAAALTLIAFGLGTQQVLEKRATAAAERERAEKASIEAGAERERADRAAFERTAMSEASKSAEVLRLATIDGRERDALVLGAQVLAPFGPNYENAPIAAVEGITRALPAMLPIATLPVPSRPVTSNHLSDSAALLVLALGDGRELQVWRTSPPALERTITVGDGEAVSQISRDDRLIATSDGANCVVYRVATGQIVHTLPQCSRPAFSVDGQMLVGGAPWPHVPDESVAQDRLKAWELVKGTLSWQTPPAPHGVTFVIHPDGEHVVLSRSHESFPRLVAIDSGTEHSIDWHDAPAPPGLGATLDSWLPVLSPDGRQVVLALLDSLPDKGAPALLRAGRIAIFDLQSHEAQVFPTVGTKVAGFSRDGRSLLESRHVWLNPAWTSETIVYGIDGHRESGSPRWARYRTVPWTVLGMTSVDAVLIDFAELNVLSLAHGSLLRQSINLETQLRGGGFAFSPESELFAQISPNNEPTIWRSSDTSEVQRWSPPPGEHVVTYDDESVLTRDQRRVFRLHDRSGRRLPRRLTTTLDRVIRATTTPSGVWLHGEEARVPSTLFLDANTGAELFHYTHTGTLAGGLSGDNAGKSTLFAEVPGNGGISIRDVMTSAVVCAIPGDGSQVDRLAVAEDGGWVALIRASRSLALWSIRECVEILSTQAPPGSRLDTAGGRWLTVHADDVTLVIDAEVGQIEIEVRTCPEGAVSGPPILSADGRFLLTSCRDRELVVGHLWDVEDHSILATIDDQRIAHARFITADGDIATDWNRKWTFFSAATGMESFQLHPRYPVGSHRQRNDGRHVDIRDRFGDVIHTYPTTRTGLVTAACRALMSTEAAGDVEDACRSPRM